MNRLLLAVVVWFLPWVVAPVYAGEIQGTVRTEGSATGIGGATVLAASLSIPGNQFFAQSESDGTYSVTVPDGTYAVAAQRAGFSSELYLEQPCCEPAGTPTPVVVGSGATVSGIDFSLTQGARIQGRVVRLSDATALGGIVVRALVAGTSTVAATGNTDALGDYTLTLSPGSYDIEALGAGTFGDELFPARQCWNGFCRGTVVSQTIVGSEIRTGIDFSLAPPARISVPVRDAGTTLLIEGRALYWFDDALSDAAREQMTASGVATLELPGAGSVRLGAASLHCGPAADTECLTELFPDLPCALAACDPATGSAIVFTKGQVVTGPAIALAAGGSIGGLVSSVGLPVAGATVKLFAADAVDFSGAPRITATTDGTGAYRIGGLDAAPALVLARAKDFVPMLFDAVPCPLSQCAPASGTLISVQPGIPSQNINFALQGAGVLSGRVVDAGRNEPLGGATVHLHTVTGAEIGSTTTQPDGTWRLADLPAAAYFVRFSHPQFSGVVFNGLPCVNNNCDVTFGTDVVVTVGAETPDIDAAMARIDGGDGNFRLVYLNNCQTGNCTFTRGTGNNNSSTNHSSLISGTRNVAAFSGSEVTWQAAVACIRDVLGPYRLTVTTTDPGLTPHHEAVIAGLPSQIGMGSGVSGVSPFSCGEIPRTITFTFGNLFPDDVLELCWTATHEIAHSFGLEHEMYCPDSMTYQRDCGFKRYTDVLAAVGTAGQCQPANECQCGRSQQNAHQMMLGAVGRNPQVFDDGFEANAPAKMNWREVLQTMDAKRRFDGRCGTTDRPADRGLSSGLNLSAQ